MKPWQIRGIQKRWMINNLGIVALILLLIVVMFTVTFATSTYSGMLLSLETRANVDTNSLSFYGSRSEYLSAARSYVESFSDDWRIEAQMLTGKGSVVTSSYSLTISGTVVGTPDVSSAQESGALAYWTGNNPLTGERILSVSSPLIYQGETLGILRYVTSLTLADRQVAFVACIALLIGLIILLLIYFSNLYFVRSIVEPLVEITELAKHIAAGSYGIQFEPKRKNEQDDEITGLATAINDMSRSIKMAENMKSEFISSVSHELRTPLTAINGWAETIMNGETRDEADVRKGMGIITSEARRLTNMVEELLEFSRIEDGRFTLSIEPIDIKAELEDAVYTYREFFHTEGISLIHSDCDEEFPNLSGDPARLRQVFCNLLDNAAKHGGSGQQIETAIFPDGDFVSITIRDHGPGVPEEELPHIKFKFYKGSSTARGSGIGLAVCEEIISRHSGRLDLENAPDHGLIVTIRLPRSMAEAKYI